MSRKYKITVNPAFSYLDDVVRDVARNGLPSDTVLIHKGRNRVGWIEREGIKLNIKAFKVPIFINRIVYTHLRPSKAARSYDNAMRLLSLGFLTPEPVAYIEETVNGLLTRSYYISRQIQGGSMRRLPENPLYEPLLEAVAADLVRMHREGVWMKDFTPGNVLWAKNTSGNGFDLYYVDLNRIDFGVRDMRLLSRCFSAFVYDDADVVKFAQAYARAASLAEDTVVALARAARRRYLTLRERKHRFKRSKKRSI